MVGRLRGTSVEENEVHGVRREDEGLPVLRRWRDYPCLVLVAVGLWASFPDVNWWWLSVPTMAVFIAVVDRVRSGRAAWYCGLVGMGFWMAHTEWARVATGGWLPWVALALTQAIAWAIWGWSMSLARVWRLSRTWWGETLIAVITWVGVEQLRSRVPFGGFPWANLSYAQVDSPLGRLAPFGGEVLVSAAVVAAAVLLRRTFTLVPAQDPGRWWGRPALLVLVVVLLVAPLAITLPTSQEAGSVRVGVVQGNVEIPGDQTFSIPNKVTGNHVRETEALAADDEHPDLVLWGENSADLDPQTTASTRDLISSAVNAVGVPTLVGFVEYDQTTRKNWVGFWYPGTGLDTNLYGKQHPVPFGEYIPWRAFVSSLATETAQVSVDMVPVDNPAYMEARINDGRTIPLAVGICFEVAYEPLIAEGVNLGGQLIAIPTNNYHFRYSAESTQQAQMLRFRAMEYSRSAVQASTNGVSTIVRPDGSVVASVAKQTAGHIVADLPLRTSMTVAARMGEIPAWIVIGAFVTLTLMSLGALLISRRKS